MKKLSFRSVLPVLVLGGVCLALAHGASAQEAGAAATATGAGVPQRNVLQTILAADRWGSPSGAQSWPLP